MRTSLTLTSGVLVLITGCGSEPVCTEEADPAVVIEIRDAVDHTPLARTASGTVRDGNFVQSLRPYRTVGNSVLVSRAAASGRAGVYSVVVQHEGYFDWSIDAVHVPRDTCGVQTMRVTADLQRSR